VAEAGGDSGRLRQLVKVGISLASERSFEVVYRRLVEAVVALTGARAGALVVAGEGQADEERLLASAGGPVTAAFAVPITVGGAPFGTLLLGEKEDGTPFTEEDEELLTLLAAQGAAAIENARTFEAETQAEERLRASEARHRLLLEAVPDLIFVVSDDGVIFDYWALDESELIAPPSELLGRSIRDIVPAELAERVMANIAEARRTGAIRTFEYELAIGGEPRAREARIVPDGESRVLALVRDVTDRSRRAHLEQAERQFVTNAAHELQTPLSAIASAVEALELGAKENPAERDRFLVGIRRECDRLERLIRALLTLARAQAGKEGLTLGPVELRPLLEEIAGSLDVPEEIHVEVRCPPGLAAHADFDLIERMLSNLAANAVHYTDRGRIVFSCRKLTGRAVELEVRDTGLGIPPADQERIFDRFYRGGERSGDGFGLGLAIVREGAHVLGGDVEVKSTPGAGTTVRVTLPATA
jgi:PAS domain S-box-containing protein